MLCCFTFTRDHEAIELEPVFPTLRLLMLSKGQGQHSWTQAVPRLPPDWFHLGSCLSLAGLAAGIAARGRGCLPSAAGKQPSSCSATGSQHLLAPLPSLQDQ